MWRKRALRCIFCGHWKAAGRWIIAGIGALTSPVVLADDIRLSSFYIPLMVESRDKGVFIELVKEIESRIPHTIDLTVYPANRTLNYFHKSRVDGFFPALDVMVQKEIQRSTPIYIKQDFAFVRAGSRLPKNISELRGMKVGLTQGYAYSDDLMNVQAQFIFAHDDVSNIRKLDLGRLDVFLVEEKSGIKALKLSGVSDISYDSQHPLSQQDVYFAFQNTDKGYEYAKMFSDSLADMKTDGSFVRIMAQAQ